MLKASALSDDPAANLQLGLGVELAVLPPYLYALWSIKSREEGASDAAMVAAKSIRAVVYEEMLHAALVGNILNALGVTPKVAEHLMTYPGPLPGHATEPPYGYNVGLGALSPASIATFMRIELPEWDVTEAQSPSSDSGWITIAAFYDAVKEQLGKLPASAFTHGRQLPTGDNPGPGRLVSVVDLPSALQAIDTIVDQGEGHKPPPSPPDHTYEDDDDHEVAHYYQFQTIGTYFTSGMIDRRRDLYPVVENPDAAKYSPPQRKANDTFNAAYSALIDSLQAMFDASAPRAFGAPTHLMNELSHAAAVLRSAGTIPGTDLLAGPTFTYRAGATRGGG